MENTSDLNFIYVSVEVTETDWTVFETISNSTSETPVIAFKHRLIVASILIVFSIIGIFGNALVIISVVVEKKLRTITNILVVNLALADFIACSFAPFQSIALFSQTGRYPLPEIVCAIVAGVLYISISCSVFTLVAIAFVRWYVITKSIRGHQGFHTPKKIAAVCVIIWVQAVVTMIVPPVLGIGTLGYSEFYSICSLTDSNPLDFYYSLIQGTLIALALLLTLTFYFLILRHVLRHSKHLKEKFGAEAETISTSTQARQSHISTVSRSDSRPPMIKAISKREIEITKNLYTVVCVFMLCFLASSVNFIIPGRSVATLYTTMILLANGIVNPIIYGLKHPNFQEAFKRILCHVCCCRVA